MTTTLLVGTIDNNYPSYPEAEMVRECDSRRGEIPHHHALGSARSISSLWLRSRGCSRPQNERVVGRSYLPQVEKGETMIVEGISGCTSRDVPSF